MGRGAAADDGGRRVVHVRDESGEERVIQGCNEGAEDRAHDVKVATTNNVIERVQEWHRGA